MDKNHDVDLPKNLVDQEIWSYDPKFKNEEKDKHKKK